MKAKNLIIHYITGKSHSLALIRMDILHNSDFEYFSILSHVIYLFLLLYFIKLIKSFHELHLIALIRLGYGKLPSSMQFPLLFSPFLSTKQFSFSSEILAFLTPLSPFEFADE
jgi:hypothetical protein